MAQIQWPLIFRWGYFHIHNSNSLSKSISHNTISLSESISLINSSCWRLSFSHQNLWVPSLIYFYKTILQVFAITNNSVSSYDYSLWITSVSHSLTIFQPSEWIKFHFWYFKLNKFHFQPFGSSCQKTSRYHLGTVNLGSVNFGTIGKGLNINIWGPNITPLKECSW